MIINHELEGDYPMNAGETAFPTFLRVLEELVMEVQLVRQSLNRIEGALEEANRLEGNHPSRI